MMKKSMVAVLFSMIFALILGTTGAFAAESAMSADIEKALEQVAKTNDEIYKEIEKAQEKSYKMYDKKVSDIEKEKDAEKILRIEMKYEEEITELIAKLDKKTQKMTRKGIEKAKKAGLTVEVEWVSVQFADRTAMIDPIKVIDW